MRRREKVPGNPASPGQVGEILARIAPLITFTSDEVEKITKDPKEGKRFTSGIRRVFDEFRLSSTAPHGLLEEVTRWSRVYFNLFGDVPDFFEVTLPPKPEGLGPMRLIVVPRDLEGWTGGNPIQGVMNALKKHFPTWQYAENLDSDIPTHERSPNGGSYAVWVKDVREADEENQNKSANDLTSEKDAKWMTVLERVLMEADYFWERGEHLDLQNITLCAGSRSHDGLVPGARWRDDGFYVRWCSPSGRDLRLRARRVWG